ncbi:MAG: hypothetical protein M1828_005918 [Chrysothrix sp. TS-e1954]|nr:MAG: hypothetical protein M1828_005918 [Chrysothrix sp. TS-e1954]
MLTDTIQVRYKHAATSPEDILADCDGSLFPDETRNQHGDPDAVVTYRSTQFGDITLSIADPASEESRKLFAHSLWNAGIYLSGLISERSSDSRWSVVDETVLELGAGVGLCGIISALSGAKEVVISDYPATEILTNLRGNVSNNVGKDSISSVHVQGHEWGCFNDEFSNAHRHSFGRVLAADCLWMPQEHDNLIKSIDFFLKSSLNARAFVVAGFHTGRAKVAPFFEKAEAAGFEIELEEVDVDDEKRPWQPERDGGMESVTERKRWLVVASLRRRGRRNGVIP